MGEKPPTSAAPAADDDDDCDGREETSLTDYEADDGYAGARGAEVGDGGGTDDEEEVEEEEAAEKGGGVRDGVEARHEERDDAGTGDDEQAREVGDGEGEEEGPGVVRPDLVLPEEHGPLGGNVRRAVPERQDHEAHLFVVVGGLRMGMRSSIVQAFSKDNQGKCNNPHPLTMSANTMHMVFRQLDTTCW